MNDEAREKYYSIIDKKLVELFICCRNKEEYHFFNFSSALIKLEDEIRYNEVPEQAKRRFYDYVYYLNDIFNTTYSTLAISNIIYDDNAQIKRINFRQTCNNGEIIENTTEYLYSEILNIEDDKKLSHAMMQEQIQQSYSWFSTYSTGMNIPMNNFEDIKLMRRLKNMKLSYCPDGYRPPKNFAQFRGDLLAMSDTETIDTGNKENENIFNTAIQVLIDKFIKNGNLESKTEASTQKAGKTKKNTNIPHTDLAKKWLLISDREEFIGRNKQHIQGKKGKELYMYIIAMQKNKQLKAINTGEVRELFRFLETTFGAEGSREAFNTAYNTYNVNKTTYYTHRAIDEICRNLK